MKPLLYASSNEVPALRGSPAAPNDVVHDSNQAVETLAGMPLGLGQLKKLVFDRTELLLGLALCVGQ